MSKGRRSLAAGTRFLQRTPLPVGIRRHHWRNAFDRWLRDFTLVQSQHLGDKVSHRTKYIRTNPVVIRLKGATHFAKRTSERRDSR